MLSILLGHAYFLRFDQKQVERAKPYPPLATLQVAALLRRAGHEVALFDAMLAESTVEFEHLLQTLRPQLVLLYEDSFNFLSKMCLGRMRRAACEMIEFARRRAIRVVAGGPDASDTPEIYLRAGADVVLLGEGLACLPALLRRIEPDLHAQPTDWIDGLAGLAALYGGEVRKTSAANLLPATHYPDLPAWDLVDIERYRRLWTQAHGYFSLNMAASRGCSFRCAWCAKPIWGNQYLQRPSESVATEMDLLKRNFAVDHIWFADDIFGFRVDWVRQFAAALRTKDGAVPFSIQTRADLISDRMAVALRDAGCCEAWIGAESGSQRVLDAMNKGVTVAEIVTARVRLKTAGIRVGFFIQLGYLDEDLEDILATRALLETALPDDVGVSVSYPLPGTKFYELVKTQLGIKTHWQQSNDLEMMFHGTYSSGFYRVVRDLLHERVTLESLNSTFCSEQYRQGKHLLERRWSELMSNEQLHRNERQPAAQR